MADAAEREWLERQIARRAPLSNDGQMALRALSLVTRTYEPSQYLLREGDRPKHCSFLRSGFVYRHKIVGNGGRQIVAIHLEGDFVDVQNILLTESDHNIQALTMTKVLCISREDLVAVSLAHPSLARALWRESLLEASIMREWVANVGRRDARSRTAHMLCELAIRQEAAGIGPREAFDLPMTQEQLGDALGLTAVHINRTLKSLEAAALIARSKRSVTVTDWHGLQRVADFTSGYLHLPDVDH
ncbi:Crp/Fnr family transcriptional regulator [Sphingomonas sp.]|uniref:Crp/Fnr family transcriptional regulator n=1 Tax=Sphingomonas sp. TaxID=28214 RepID=UPI003D6CAA4A